MKTIKIKVIQNFMEITFYIKTYSKRTCWKKFFKFKFWLFFVDIWRRIRLQAMATRQQPPTNQNKNIVSKIETENKMLKKHFSASFFREIVKTKSDLHKILDNFYHKHFLIEETTSYVVLVPSTLSNTSHVYCLHKQYTKKKSGSTFFNGFLT